MSDNEEIAALLAQLKRSYRHAGIAYADVASALEVSQPTVKRWMLGKGLTLSVLAQLCEVASLTISELVDAARNEEQSGLPLVTQAQTKAISGDIILGMVFFLLMRRWPVSRIQAELPLDGAALDGVLARLDRIGVIALFPGNRVRLLRRTSGDIRDDGGMFDLVARRVHEFFDAPDLSDPELAWTSGIARLSPSSAAKIADKLNQLRDEVMALGEADLDLTPDHVRWFMLFAAARPVSVKELLYGRSQQP